MSFAKPRKGEGRDRLRASCAAGLLSELLQVTRLLDAGRASAAFAIGSRPTRASAAPARAGVRSLLSLCFGIS